jgi:diguanylate cyclase (GGDEF)-like protein/PAS domain S-box-containing protein
MAMRQLASGYRALFDYSPLPMWVYDRQTLRFVDVNSEALRHYGYSLQEFMGMTLLDIRPAEDAARLKQLHESPHLPFRQAGEWRHRKKDGSIISVLVTANEIDWNGRPAHVAVMNDVTAQRSAERVVKDAEEQIAFVTSHDLVTGLPNTALFLDRLHLSIVQSTRSQGHLAVLSVHIDKFSTVTDTRGPAIGDSVLRELANRLRGALKEGDTLARPGGDEFLIVIPGLARPADVAETAQALLAAVRSPVNRGESQYFLTASIGISLHHSGDPHLDHLIRDASAAATQVKGAGGNGFRFFTPEIHAEAVRRLSIESELRQALEHGQFDLVYQPVLDSATRATVGAEALLRWRHPSRGIVSPMEFVPVAEAAGLIVPIGTWVLRQACAMAGEWQRQGRKDVGIAVNVSPRQLQQPDFPKVVEEAIADSGIAPEQCIFEITESTLATEGESNRVRFLADLGVRLAIDDFGTGYSSLGYLKRFPIYSLKIDKSFVDNIDSDSSNRAITQAIIKLASTFGFFTVAEGVETHEQARILSELGCTMMQGYYFGRPMSLASFLETLQA